MLLANKGNSVILYQFHTVESKKVSLSLFNLNCCKRAICYHLLFKVNIYISINFSLLRPKSKTAQINPKY